MVSPRFDPGCYLFLFLYLKKASTTTRLALLPHIGGGRSSKKKRRPPQQAAHTWRAILLRYPEITGYIVHVGRAAPMSSSLSLCAGKQRSGVTSKKKKKTVVGPLPSELLNRGNDRLTDIFLTRPVPVVGGNALSYPVYDFQTQLESY